MYNVELELEEKGDAVRTATHMSHHSGEMLPARTLLHRAEFQVKHKGYWMEFNK